MKNNIPTFDEFWRAYPLHRDRYRAEKTWNRLTAADKRAALAALPAYIADCQQEGIKYKYAHGWLNGRRWEDKVEIGMELPESPDAKSRVSSENGKPKPETSSGKPDTGLAATLFDMDTW